MLVDLETLCSRYGMDSSRSSSCAPRTCCDDNHAQKSALDAVARVRNRLKSGRFASYSPWIQGFARVRACQESQGRRSCPIVTPPSRCASGSASWRPSAFLQRSRACRRFAREASNAQPWTRKQPRWSSGGPVSSSYVLSVLKRQNQELGCLGRLDDPESTRNHQIRAPGAAAVAARARRSVTNKLWPTS